jgi:hypothetical protein
MNLSYRHIVLLLFFICNGGILAQEQIEFKGVSLSAANAETRAADIEPIVNIGANWLSVVPYAFLRDDQVYFDSKFQWTGERPDAVRKCIQIAHDKGLKVMLKPHVWLGHGGYTGDFICESDEAWNKFETTYTKYIMSFVDLAIEEDVEMFAIGTEWGSCVEQRPEYWIDLIRKIKGKYKGKLTYAANWDDFQRVPFWSELDYIGIDSYFQLSLYSNPKFFELMKSWKAIVSGLELFSAQHKKKIVFTEYGYKSTEDATVSPWEHKSASPFSEKVQDNAFKSFFQTIWKKQWFKGGFIWKWYHNHDKAGGRGDTDFTPQNKLAEETIKKYYSN